MKHVFKFLLAFLICSAAQAQITLSSNFTSNQSRGNIMTDHLDTYNRINPEGGFRSPIVSNAGIGLVRPLGGLVKDGRVNLDRDTYRWNAQRQRYETDFTTLTQQLDQVERQGFQVHQIVLDNPSWDFQRDARGRFPGGRNNYIISTYGNATPPVSNTRWTNYLREAVQAIVDHLGIDAASEIQYGIGREIGTSGHWTGTQFQFFEFYRLSVEAVRSVIPNAKIGSHFLWGTSNNFWAVDFLGYCSRNNVPYDFVAVSYYPFYNRANRTNFDLVYRDDFRVITTNRNWNRNAKLEVHEFALIKSLSNGGASFDEAPAQHQNSFLVGMMKMFYQNGMNNLTLWGNGEQYGPAFTELRSMVGNRFYRNAKSGDQRFDGNFVNGLFSRNERDNSYDIMAYNYSADVNRNQRQGTAEDIVVRATISSPPGTRYRWRVVTYNPSNNTVRRSGFQEATTTGRAGSNSSLVQFPSRSLDGYSWFKYEFNVVSQSGGGSNATNTNDITGTWYRLRNRFTNRYLDAGSRFSLGTEASATGFDKQFRFVRAGNFYNIDVRRESASDSNGILRAMNNNNRNVTVTNTAPTSFNNEMQWTIAVNSNNIATFRNRALNAYLRDSGGTATHDPTNDTNHTRWTLERVTNVSSKDLGNLGKIDDEGSRSIFAFPNPSENGVFQLNQAGAWRVYNLNGQLVLSGQGNTVDVSPKQRGVYILTIQNERIRLVY